MTKHFLIILVAIFYAIPVSSQVESNSFFEVLDSIPNRLPFCMALDSSRFIISSNKAEWDAYILDGDGKKEQLPCSRLTKINIEGKTKYYRCHQDTLSIGLKTNESKSLVSKEDDLYDVVRVDEDGMIQIVQDTMIDLGSFGKLDKQEIENFGLRKFSDGSFTFRTDRFIGLKAANGDILIEPQYQSFEEIGEEQYVVSLRNIKGLNGNYAIINQSNQVLLSGEYTYIYHYEFGAKVVNKSCKSMLLDSQLKNIYNEEFDNLSISPSGLILAKLGDQVYYDLPYGKDYGILKEGIVSAVRVKENVFNIKYKSGKNVLINQLGQEFFVSKNSNTEFKGLKQKMIRVSLDGNHGIVNDAGQWVIALGKYSFKVSTNLNGIYVTENSTRESNLFNLSGELIYSNVKSGSLTPPFHNFILRDRLKSGAINTKGEILIPFEEYRIKEYKVAPGFYLLTKGNMSYLVKLKEPN